MSGIHPLSCLKHMWPLLGTDAGLPSAHISKWKIHSSGIFNILVSTSTWILPSNFIQNLLKNSMQGICPCWWFSGDFYQIPQSLTLSFHTTAKQSTCTRTMPDSAASGRCRLVLLDHRSSCLCASLWVSLLKQFLGDHFHQGTLKALPV